ncbi:phage gp6-like head-tail connector protein [Andreesenia angusta]|uniref:Phage gp6-like head-tail connector protein n=1 Tax=Andreesenia angusta TaxID=39480 RepID=A0A1S1V3V3_9FIRM|nr:head-tail connector protein [Andreesenia angusta]OHW61386.1 phage gp6-like head-tail connector protein [Andreesenia angusta]
MELPEIKTYLRIDGIEEDTLLAGLQVSSEKYLENAGVRKDYTNELYKTTICLLISHFYENRQFEQVGSHVARMSLNLDTMINQLRYSQEDVIL